MKNVYELVFKTADGNEHNLLFSSKRKANKNLLEEYYIGKTHYDTKITNSFVIKRILF